MGENISLFLGLKSVFKVSSHRGISDQSHKWQGTWVGLLFYVDHTSIATITVIIRQCKTLWKTPGENVLLWDLEIKTFIQEQDGEALNSGCFIEVLIRWGLFSERPQAGLVTKISSKGEARSHPIGEAASTALSSRQLLLSWYYLY